MTPNNNHQAEQPASDGSCTNEQTANGVFPPAADRSQPTTPTDASPASTGSANVARAEQITDQLTAKCAAVTAACVRKLARLNARAREAAQDFWAEVQSVSRKDQS